ncbi:MAG: class I SAM-dependent methyltransferase [Dehalococcoidia bacterium]|nr:class I SAM-dependent methyltransferase [Dehalococcoidia bacterium]
MSRPIKYNYDQDYKLPYHWLMSPDDLRQGGLDYWQYVKLICELIISKPGEKILDVGCGDGCATDYIARCFPEMKVKGIDLSERAIAFAKLLSNRVEFECRSIYDEKGKYVYITMIEVLEHIHPQEVQQFLQRVRELLKPEGALVLSVPTPHLPVTINPSHYQHFDLLKLKDALARAHMKVEKVIFHLDLRFSRYSILWRQLLRLCDNRIYTFKPGLSVLRWFHKRIACRTNEAHAARIVVRAGVE